MQEILHKELHNSFTITNRDVFLGITDPAFDKLNFVIIHAKYYLYCCRCNKILPTMFQFIYKLKLSCAIEKQIALSRDRLDSWNKKWDLLNI